MKKNILIVIIFSFILVSCHKKDDDPETIDTGAIVGLNELMHEWYYWYKKLPEVKTSDFKDPYALMDTLRYKTFDRWSFVADYDEFIASMQGTFVGHGIRIGVDSQGKARIVTIYNNSPMYGTIDNPRGVRRGWIIKSINGQDPAPIILSQNATAYNNMMGPSVEGRINTFIFQTPRGNDTTFTTAKTSFQVNSVMLFDTLTINSVKTGHLVFDEFIEPSPEELKTAFKFFKEQNIKDLILDLRYNSGGILDVAAELASYIVGTPSFSSTFASSTYNDKKSSEESDFSFKTVSYPLNLTKLIVITTSETASASEEVINGVKPFMPVITIGTTTNGKPTGMDVFQYNNKYIYAPITFELVNSAGIGGFYDGFAPAKYVTDDITRDFNDKSEACFKEAIYYLQHGTVSSKKSYESVTVKTISEKPIWMNNLYNFDRLMDKK
jgi:carboxyl-terminal processing protease